MPCDSELLSCSSSVELSPTMTTSSVAHQQWALPPGYWLGCSPLTPSFHLCLPSEKKVSPFFLEVIASLKIFAICMLLSITLLWSRRLLKIKTRPDFNIREKFKQNQGGYTPFSFQKCFHISSSKGSFFSSTTTIGWRTDESNFGFKIGVGV